MMILKQKGQATIEYLMLFTVTLMITVGLVFQFNDAFRNFVNNYFGAYLSCLLESGELPSLGWEATSPEEESCSSEFQPFNLASGRQPINPIVEPMDTSIDSGGAQVSSANPGSGVAQGGSVAAAAAGPGGEASGGNTVSAGTGGWGASGNRGAASQKIPLSNSDTGSAGRSRPGSSEGSVTASGDSSGAISGSSRYIPLVEGEIADEDLKKKRAPIPVEVAQEPNVRRVPADAVKKDKPTSTDEGEFTVFDFVKYIIIAGIIIAMLIFLGGQAVQVSKSQEK